ncbi:MAG: EamA family transporter [Clostridiales bacterium]|nr:EamA family transporter [Clostridiales bacterium]
MSVKYLLCYAVIIIILGIYAILWQQAIKGFNPSVAYSNKSVTTIWVLLFSELLFNEGITVNNIIGAVLIMLGVVLVTKNE